MAPAVSTQPLIGEAEDGTTPYRTLDRGCVHEIRVIRPAGSATALAYLTAVPITA